MPLVSVITPCYNSIAYLEATVASVLAQTHTDLELLLIDDGSTDGTRALIETLARQHACVVPSFWDNGGAATARNRGLQQARGEYIQFLDADDLLAPEAIAQRLQTLQRSSADVAYSDWQRLEETDPGVFVDGAITARRIEDVDADPALALFTSFWCPPAALLYRRSIVERIGGWKQHLAPIEDARYMLDVVLHGGSYVHVPGVGAHYRLYHAPSHSRRSPLKFLLAVLTNAGEVEALWQQRGGCSALQRLALAKVYDYTARMLLPLDTEAFERALDGLYRARPGLDWCLPKAAGLARRFIGTALTKRLLILAGKLPA